MKNCREVSLVIEIQNYKIDYEKRRIPCFGIRLYFFVLLKYIFETVQFIS